MKLKRNILRKSKLLQKVDRLRAEAKEAEAAADLKAGYTRPPRTSSSQGSAAAAEAAAKFKQQETYGHQFTFEVCARRPAMFPQSLRTQGSVAPHSCPPPSPVAAREAPWLPRTDHCHRGRRAKSPPSANPKRTRLVHGTRLRVVQLVFDTPHLQPPACHRKGQRPSSCSSPACDSLARLPLAQAVRPAA